MTMTMTIYIYIYIPEPIVLPTQHVPVLSCSVSDPEVDEDSPACDSASDETSEASSNTTLPLAPPDDGSTVYDLLHGILQNDRGWARMWSMYASSQGLHQWDGVTTREKQLPLPWMPNNYMLHVVL